MKLQVSSFALVACIVAATAAEHAAESPSAGRGKRELFPLSDDAYAVAYPYAASPYAAAVASDPQVVDAPAYAVAPSYAASYVSSHYTAARAYATKTLPAPYAYYP